MLTFRKNVLILANFRHLLFLGLTICFGPLFSQDFEVGPAKLIYDCEPGQIQTKTMTVRNHSNSKQQFVLIASDLKLDTAKIQKQSTSSKSCKDWITITPAFFDLNPNEVKEVKVVMQAPPGESGTKGAVIYVSATEEQNALGADVQMRSSIKVRPRIAVKVVQSPRSNVNYSAALSDLKEITTQVDSVRSFQVKVLNNGDKMLDGKLYLVLSNLETAKEIKQRPLKLSLFPGVSQTMTLVMPANVPPGKYSLAAILDYGGNAALEAVQMNIEVK